MLYRMPDEIELPPSQKPARTVIHHALIGAAGVYHVVSDLSRRGMIALPTIRNTKGYDIIVTNPTGTKRANIDVKTSQKRVGFWPMPSSRVICHGPHDYYVLLRWLESAGRFEGFMLTGIEALKGVKEDENSPWNRKRVSDGKRAMPAIYIAGTHATPKLTKKWRTRWETWAI
jgi:hypothetical protein